jgi:signal transduction histidine kinase
MIDDPTPVELLTKLLTTIPDGLLVVDVAGVVRYANRPAHELFQRPPGGLTGETLGLPPVTGVRDIELVLEDGTLRTVEMRAVATTWGGEQVWVISLRDATEERRRQQELQTALLASSELTSELTHELSTPLAVIIGFADTLERRWDDLPEAARRDLLHRLAIQARRLHRMIRRMLLAGSNSAPSTAPTVEPVELWEVALSHLPDLGVSSVHIDCPTDLRVLADPAHVDEIVVNLVENADKYGEPPITVRARRSGDMVELSVCDRGRGVPEEFVPHLFERFSRAEETLRQQSGTGLGLYLVARLARACGGSVRYQPNDPHGACFVVRLPAA